MMDIKANTNKGHFDVDIVIPAIATTDVQELARRQHDSARALRAAAADKLKRYGPSVIAFAVDDSGRLGPQSVRFLRELARGLEPDDADREFVKLRAEVQHIVLQATASMAQAARGVPRTA